MKLPNTEILTEIDGKIRFTSKDSDGNIIDQTEFSDNSILNTAREIFINSILEGNAKNVVDVIKLGTDMGNGVSALSSEVDPEDESNITHPIPSTNALTENEYVFSKRVDSISFVNQESVKRIKVLAIFDSSEVLEYYEKLSESDRIAALPVTSISLYSRTNLGFSYKRFPARYLIRGITIEIDWIIDWPGFGVYSPGSMEIEDTSVVTYFSTVEGSSSTPAVYNSGSWAGRGIILEMTEDTVINYFSGGASSAEFGIVEMISDWETGNLLYETTISGGVQEKSISDGVSIPAGTRICIFGICSNSSEGFYGYDSSDMTYSDLINTSNHSNIAEVTTASSGNGGHHVEIVGRSSGRAKDWENATLRERDSGTNHTVHLEIKTET